MYKLTQDQKIAYLDRMIPKDSLVEVVRGFNTEEDADKVAVEIKSVGKDPLNMPTVSIGDVYCIELGLLSKYTKYN